MSIDDVKTNHTAYAKLKREAELIQLMTDEYELKRRCKEDQGDENSLLPKPLSYSRPNDAPKEKKLYERYVDRSYMPEHILSDASEEMVGICFRVTPKINLPDKIKYLEKHVDSEGNSLIAMAETFVRDLISTRRATVSTDYIDGRVVLQHKKSSTLVNWSKNSTGYTMMAFEESYTDLDDTEREQRRHYSILSGTLIITVYRKDSSGDWFEYQELDKSGNAKPQPTLAGNKPYDYIPVRVAETIKPALLGMARTVIQGFKTSADYYLMLHTLTPTVVVKTNGDPAALTVGFENGIHIGTDDAVEILQPGTDGSDPNRIAMETLFNSAVDQGVRLVSESTAQQSGEAIYLRNANKQIKIDSVAREASEQIEEGLRVAAILEGANPDEVQFKLDVELVDEPVDVGRLKEMREGVMEGIVRWEDYLTQMNESGLIVIEREKDGTLNMKKYMKESAEQHKKLVPEMEI